MLQYDFDAIGYAESPEKAPEPGTGRVGNVVMRPWLWALVLIGILTCSVSYQLTSWSRFPHPSPALFDEPKSQALDQKADQSLDQNPDQPPTDKDEARLPDRDSSSAVLQPDPPPAAQDHAPAEVLTQDLAPPEPAAGPGASELADADPTNQDLSYLAYYAYSELPPDPKPADTVLSALRSVPPGTPVEEIRRVADVLRLDFTFMKTVARIESGFDPNQRTGSYIGLFQLSNYEFGKYGSGDIRASRDNTVAAALKFMSEAALFEMFTHRTPTLNDLYLIHQQGVEGAAEHVSHPKRLAWRSMCATDEGKEKGEKWCKLAIWGNTTREIKRVWKNVNNVTSGDFIGWWQQRVSQFYSKYSGAAAN